MSVAALAAVLRAAAERSQNADGPDEERGHDHHCRRDPEDGVVPTAGAGSDPFVGRLGPPTPNDHGVPRPKDPLGNRPRSSRSTGPSGA